MKTEERFFIQEIGTHHGTSPRRHDKNSGEQRFLAVGCHEMRCAKRCRNQKDVEPRGYPDGIQFPRPQSPMNRFGRKPEKRDPIHPHGEQHCHRKRNKGAQILHAGEVATATHQVQRRYSLADLLLSSGGDVTIIRALRL